MQSTLTTAQLAARLQVTTQTIRRLVNQRRIPMFRVSERIFRFDPEAVEKSLLAQSSTGESAMK